MSSSELRVQKARQACPYLPGKTETLDFIVHDGAMLRATERHHDEWIHNGAASLWDGFGQLGFRRQGRLMYRPACEDCRECVATRVIVNEFEYKRRFQRVLRKNGDIEIAISTGALIPESESFKLYSKYIESRHMNGVMYPPDIETMRSMLRLEPDRGDLHVYGFLDDQVVFIAQTDRLADGLSANYTIFDTGLATRSLGTLAILCQIEIVRGLDLDFLYLGYALNSVKNMRYKHDFQPQERFINQRWVRTDEV